VGFYDHRVNRGGDQKYFLDLPETP